MADFIERAGDSVLLAESTQFLATVNGSTLSTLGLTAAQVTALETAIAEFQIALDQHIAAQAAAKSKTQAKDEKRDALEQLLRQFLRVIKAQEATSESDLSNFGQIATGGSYEALSNPTRPTGNVDTSERLRHTINFADEATPDQRRKPAGTLGCEIYAKYGGAPPTDEKECVFVSLDTATPYLNAFDGADAGKMVHYMLRWILKDGSRSAWSETISATVTG